MADELPANIASWLDRALADAAGRGLPELEPLLRSLAASTAALRAADWNDSVIGRVRQPPTGAPAGARRHAEGNER